MAAGLAARQAAAVDPLFVARITESMAEAAVAIYAEPPATAGHATRASFANAVLRYPAQYAASFAQAVVTQGVDQTSTDAQINTAIASVWNALAGA
jgi:hypothetical protein